MIFLLHTNTVILLEPYCGTITEPGLPVVKQTYVRNFNKQLRKESLEISGRNVAPDPSDRSLPSA